MGVRYAILSTILIDEHDMEQGDEISVDVKINGQLVKTIDTTVEDTIGQNGKLGVEISIEDCN